MTKVYPSNPKPALQDITVEIARGEFAFLVGTSGSGKSTFLRLLLREELPTKGTVVIAGRDITRMSTWKVPSLRRQIGCVFQDFRLLPDRNVTANIAFAPESIGRPAAAIRKLVPEVLELVGLTGKGDRMPGELSGGEQQRVAIARAFINRPVMLLCDEPTGNLDPATSVGIMRLLDRINRAGTTVMMATHNAEVVDAMRRRVIELDGGLLVRDQQRGVYGSGASVTVGNERMTRVYPILRDAVKGLRRNLAMSIAVVLCSAVSLTLFGCGLLLNRQVDITSKHLFGRVELTIYVSDGITTTQQAAIQTKLAHDPLVKNATYESKDDAFAEFKQLYKSSPELTDGVTADLLPASYHVKLVNPQQYSAAAAEYAHLPGVDAVQDWRGRLKGFFRFLHGFQLAAYILAGVQGLATLVLLYNTIRMSAHSRRRETSIMRLVGATRIHIQLPFILESAMAGLAGGVVAGGDDLRPSNCPDRPSVQPSAIHPGIDPRRCLAGHWLRDPGRGRSVCPDGLHRPASTRPSRRAQASFASAPQFGAGAAGRERAGHQVRRVG